MLELPPPLRSCGGSTTTRERFPWLHTPLAVAAERYAQFAADLSKCKQRDASCNEKQHAHFPELSHSRLFSQHVQDRAHELRHRAPKIELAPHDQGQLNLHQTAFIFMLCFM